MASILPGTDLSTIPMAPPPPSINSNFVSPESLATPAIVIGFLMLAMTTFVVILRLFSNYHAARGLGWDDCSCVIAFVIFLFFVVTSLEILGSARHAYDIPMIWTTPSEIKKYFILKTINGPMIFFAKLSLFMLYYRLFKIKIFIRYAIIFGIAFGFIIYFGNMTVSGVLCAPRVGQPWSVTVLIKCHQSMVFGFILGVANLALDIFLLILPIPVILAMHLSAEKKIGVLAIFMVGSFALTSSIISLVYRTKYWQGNDPNWNGFMCLICVMIETGVTIMCSSTSALVNFWKSHLRAYVAPLYSRLLSSYKKLVVGLNLVSQTSSDNQICLPESDHSKSYPGLDNKFHYVKPKEHDHSELTVFSFSIIKTKIGGGSSSRSEAGKAVVENP